MLHRVHLVRHGEVDNPAGVVYAGLPGFGLSELGTGQAAAAAGRLAGSPADLVVASPLQRAVQTATPIADALGVPLRIDDRLTEWGLATRWAGVAWADLPSRFPGELDAYLGDPTALPFAPESIAAVAERMAAAIADLDDSHSEIVVVSHQDPVQAVRLVMTGRRLTGLAVDKPGHATVITLDRAGQGWIERGSWSPPGPGTDFPPRAP